MMPDSRKEIAFEISPRFRRTLQERIARLEEGAAFDEAQLAALTESDHIRRQRHLVAAQRAEALRIRLFLDRATCRPPHPELGVHKNTLEPRL